MLKSRSLTPSAHIRINPAAEAIFKSPVRDESPNSSYSKQFLYYMRPSPLLTMRLPAINTERVGETTPGRGGMNKSTAFPPRKSRDILPKEPSPPPRKRVFRAVWTKVECEEARPEVREGAAMSECCGTLYLYGGLNNTVLSDVHCLKEVSTAWQQVKTEGMELEARYGHSMVEFSTKMVAFGGITTSSLRSQIRDCLNTVRILEPSFITPSLNASFLSCRGTSVDMRRYHSACLVGKHMVVNGGMNQKNKVLDDCSVLDLDTAKWTTSKLINDPAAVACHTAALVFEPHIKLSGVYDYCLSEPSPKLKHRGIYLFGGLNNKGEPNNTLRLIQPIKKYLICTVLSPTGRLPEPRYQHSMTLLKHINTLIVFGGKTGAPGQNGTVLNDLHILDLESLHWSEMVVAGHIPEARCAHCMGSLQEKLVLFGGITLTSFCNSETYWLEVAPHTSPADHKFFLDYRLQGAVTTRSSSTIRKNRAKLNQTQYMMIRKSAVEGTKW